MKFEYMTLIKLNEDNWDFQWKWECETQFNSYIVSDTFGEEWLNMIEVLNILGCKGWELASKGEDEKWLLKRKTYDE